MMSGRVNNYKSAVMSVKKFSELYPNLEHLVIVRIQTSKYPGKCSCTGIVYIVALKWSFLSSLDLRTAAVALERERM